jgi:branched-chain amino acid transport system permease protein
MLSFFGILFDGVAYGSLLFLISVGLSVTMGLMNIVNLAHGAFAMLGGYASVWMIRRWGVPFLATLPLCFLILALLGAVLERLFFRHLRGRSQLDQVLFTIGLTFMAVASTTFVWGPVEQHTELPEVLRGQVRVLGVGLGAYRLFLVALVAVLSVGLAAFVAKTRFGARLRAAVDNESVAAGLGIPVELLFCVTFAVGTGLAGLGGALSIDLLGLEPMFALKYLVYFLLVVAVGGVGSLWGTAVAAVVLGMFDVAGKYYVPEVGAFIIYALMIVLLLAFPAGLYGRRA